MDIVRFLLIGPAHWQVGQGMRRRMGRKPRLHGCLTLVFLVLCKNLGGEAFAQPPAPMRVPVVRVVDLDLGERRSVKLADGTTADVKLVAVDEARDSVRGAVRRAEVRLELNGRPIELTSATYHLPTRVGPVQIDCPITRGYMTNTTENHWGLVKTARLRLWPAGSSWVAPGTFVYPVRQRWFATATQMANEPTYVDGNEEPTRRRVYYHSGLDIGGAEGLVDVVAAVAGRVVSSGKTSLAGYGDTPVKPRYDVIYVLDDQGWYYRYSHLRSIDRAIRPGTAVTVGQKMGVLGKEGASGGWSHLHFEIVSRQPSGEWGTQEGYAFLWEAALRDQRPAVVAVARPHVVCFTGERVTLDGSRSWCRSGTIAAYDWTFHDRTIASGPKVERTYAQAGEYSEVLKIADGKGNIDYDFAIVQVVDRESPEPVPHSIHAAFAPTQGLHANDAVTFKVRSFGTTDGSETWDFGDGSAHVEVRSDGNVEALAPDGYATVVHRFSEPGGFLVRVERTDTRGRKATAHLYVVIEKNRA
jgi:murein DD-endopeptidase MepM/ murein hydrolase activator NlpD